MKARFDETAARPDCTACDEPVKTATISFGQAMPEDEMQPRHRAGAALRPVPRDRLVARGVAGGGISDDGEERWCKLVIINREPTEQDDIADLVIRYDIGETLGPFVGN